jgi:hypothetical protein
MLWVRGHESELLHVLFGLNGRWISADKGKITVSEWDLENNIFAGRFEVQVENTPVTGEFLVSSATKSD